VFIHGGTWRTGSSRRAAYPAELFVDHGAHYVALDFTNVLDAGGDLRVMADQVRRGIAWVYRNAESFGGDPGRLYIGGHSSGGHLCGVALVTDWRKDFGLPADTVKGGLCMIGMFDLKPARLSWRRTYIKFDDAMEHAMSSIRHLDNIRAAVTVTFGTYETPEFQRQGRAFAAALRAAGHKVTLIELTHFAHPRGIARQSVQPQRPCRDRDDGVGASLRPAWRGPGVDGVTGGFGAPSRQPLARYGAI
jgi:arylformamidase